MPLEPAITIHTSEYLALDVTAPIHHQFAEFVLTRFGHPWFLGAVVGAGVLALVLEWRSRRQETRPGSTGTE